MAMRKHPSRFRAIRPASEALEERQLLSGVVSGVDSKGDAFVLNLIGPGSIRVTKQPDAAGNATALTDRSEIETITIAGTDSLRTRLVGTVTPAAGSDGRVFFQTFTELANRNLQGGNSGLLSIDMPNFWLGLTAATAPTTTSGTEPAINIPDGVSTLRFGGVDTTAFFGTDPTRSLANNGQNDQLRVNIGMPQYAGTRIIIDKSISNATAGTATATAPGTPTQDGVTFSTVGRLGLFQANEIDGNTRFPTARFATAGGTLIAAAGAASSGVVDPIGSVRVGTNATNFNVVTSDKIRDFFIGGETNNVSLLAVNGSRDLSFGKGMDTFMALTHTIEHIKANRGAINSTIISDREIGNVQIGGDVVDTTIKSGYEQILGSVIQNPANPPAPTPQSGGLIRINIAGNIKNSIIAASTVPGSDGNFGAADQLLLPRGSIDARLEGTIDNSTVAPDSPKTAFFAKRVILRRGPVVPPNVLEAPYSGPLQPASLPGVPHPYASHLVRTGKAR